MKRRTQMGIVLLLWATAIPLAAVPAPVLAAPIPTADDAKVDVCIIEDQ